MRTLLYTLLFFLPFLTSCQMKEDLFGDDPVEEVVLDGIGLLDLELNAEKELEAPDIIVKGVDDGVLDPDSFAITILDSIGQEVRMFETFAQMKAAGDLLLSAGTYTVQATWGTNPDAGFDMPYYAGDTTCVIAHKEVTKVLLSCVLSNKKVQFRFTDEFKEQFNDDYYIVVDNGVGVLTLTNEELRKAFLSNTGVLHFTLYTTTRDQQVHTYTCDLSKNTLLQDHNNIFITIGTVPTIPDQPDVPDEPEEPEVPEDPEPEPEDPKDPTGTVNPPTIQVDITLIEKDHVIEVPSIFEDSDKPETPGTGDDTGGNDNTGGNEETKKISITGTIDGKSFDISETQTVKDGQKVVINLYLPTGLKELTVDVAIGSISLSGLNLLDVETVAGINGLLKDMGGTSQLVVPSKGEKGNLKFDISGFIPLLDKNNTFKVSIKDNDGTSTSATIKLTK